jgi:hypothetical protein
MKNNPKATPKITRDSEMWDREQQKCAELLRTAWCSEKRKAGAALFLVSDADGQPTGLPVSINSKAMREYIAARYRQQHGAEVNADALKSYLGSLVTFTYGAAIDGVRSASEATVETKADREAALPAILEAQRRGQPTARSKPQPEPFADVVARHKRAEEQRRAAESLNDEMARENNGAGERYKPRTKDNIRPISWGMSAQEIAANRSRDLKDLKPTKPLFGRKPRR